MLATAAGAVILALGGCLGTSAHRHSTTLAGAGVLRVGLSALDVDPDRLDPQRSFTGSSVELFRCCLLRTLLSYRGVPTEQGGGVLRPDLASGMPTVSADGRTWTFHLKPGLRYAPPFERDTIRGGDFVRAIERLLRLAPAPYLAQYFLVIEGATAFAAHQTDSIAGLETPDPQTLIVHLTRPTGDFGNRVALPPAAPLPPGAADNHPHDYGRFMAASGPYMIAGSQRLRGPTARPVAGFVPGRSLTLVRNPSWARASDRLRPARVDRIEVKIGGTASDLAREVGKQGRRAFLLFGTTG